MATQHLTLPQLLVLVHSLGDPDVVDWGSLIAAIERHRGEVMGHDVYGGPHEKAAALLEQLVRVPALERANGSFAASVAAAFLALNSRPAKNATPQDWSGLVLDVREYRADVRAVAAVLRGHTGAA